MLQEILRINHAVLPDEGEDSFALRMDGKTTFMCVTDGCGGLGSKRYATMENHTGAYAASRVAAHEFARWVDTHPVLPKNAEEARMLCSGLENALFQALKETAEQAGEEKGRIVGSMQRSFPTTLCALAMQEREISFWWAGDSRGYIMDDEGLHQYTADHVRGKTDAFDTLYRDAALTNFLSADKPGRIHHIHTHIVRPSVVMTATDGVYGNLPTPMEMEMLLLDTLKQARSMADWQHKLMRQVARSAQDDATLLLCPVGFVHFDELKATLLPRRESLQSLYITPVRRHKGDMAFARKKWLQYKVAYDRTGAEHE